MTKPLLFTPITIRDVTLKNRVVIAPMATYSAVDGIAQDFHFAHWGRLVLGGAGCVFVEATAVTDQGRITNGDLGIWSAAHMPPLQRIAEFMKAQGVVPGIQLAHAGRKGSMQRPWYGNGAADARRTSRAARRPGTPSRRPPSRWPRATSCRGSSPSPISPPSRATGWMPPSARSNAASRCSRSTTRTAT